MSHIHLSIQDAHALAAACLKANGCNDENAEAIATTIMAAEGDGSAGHGLFRLPGYVASLRSGKVDGKASPSVDRPAPAMVRVNANGGYAPLALEAGRQPLIEAAREQGIAMMALVRAHHFAALWVEIEPLARAGLCAMACTSYMPAMPPAGGAEKLYGTNPVAFGWPRKDAPPMVWDQASAALARGEIMVAARDGHTMPPGVGLDSDGNATTDPRAILDGGMILPFGGYKGSNLAMMVELLAGGLIGEHFSFEAAEHDNKDGGPPRGGEFILAMDPSRLGGDTWLEHSEAFFTRFLSIEGTRMPAARRYANREKLAAEGVDVPEELHVKIVELSNG